MSWFFDKAYAIKFLWENHAIFYCAKITLHPFAKFVSACYHKFKCSTTNILYGTTHVPDNIGTQRAVNRTLTTLLYLPMRNLACGHALTILTNDFATIINFSKC